MDEHIIAAFDRLQQAEAARSDLQANRIAPAAIRVLSHTDPEYKEYATRRSTEGAPPLTASQTQTQAQAQTGGLPRRSFWATLFGGESDFASPHETEVYDSAVASGGGVLMITVPEDQTDMVMRILNEHHPIDIEERASKYEGKVAGTPLADDQLAGRTEQAETYPDGRVEPSMGTMRVPGSAAPPSPTMPPQTAASRAETAAENLGNRAHGEEVIPLAEERLNIGTRQINRGTTRIRRYVVEKPVEQQVTLHDEKVTIERRAPTTSGPVGEGAFQERIVEVRETAEEPVVIKEAVVTEEVVIGSEVTERVETVHDTARREEVEIEGKDRPLGERREEPAKPVRRTPEGA